MVDLRPARGPRMALQLSSRDDGLEVRVVESPAGEDVASRIALQPFDEVQRMADQPTFHEQVGRGLFRALFPGKLGELYRAAHTQALTQGEPLALELRFDRDLTHIARYPWELIHDGTRFLLQASAVNLARYITAPEPSRPLSTARPLQVLVVSAHPKDRPPLASEFEALKQAFIVPIREDQLDLATLVPPTWDMLMEWLIAGAPGVLHFEGHGAFEQTGFLIFEDADGEADPINAATLAAALYGSDLRLAVLSACETSKVAGKSLLGSVAPSLILAGIPAVIAMQQSLPDDAALRFARGFYTALLAGQDIEAAVAAGRKQLIRTTFWHVPTLYLRTVKTPQITRAYLERRIDTAGPRSAPVNLPLRFGLWVRRTDSPRPSEKDLRRLLGLEPEKAVSRAETRAPMQFPVEVGEIQPGVIEVKLVAPGCDIHTTAVKHMTVFPDFDTPPLWYALTPRQPGRLEIIFEVTQNNALIASVAHTIRITEEAEGPPVASVKSHGAEPPPAPKPAPAPPPETERVMPCACDVVGPSDIVTCMCDTVAHVPPVPPPAPGGDMAETAKKEVKEAEVRPDEGVRERKPFGGMGEELDPLAEALNDEYERKLTGDESEPDWYTEAVAEAAAEADQPVDTGADDLDAEDAARRDEAGEQTQPEPADTEVGELTSFSGGHYPSTARQRAPVPSAQYGPPEYAGREAPAPAEQYQRKMSRRAEPALPFEMYIACGCAFWIVVIIVLLVLLDVL
ncbi:MAG: CHAT domain-containing protein [Anaerolineae bacterium]|nr:CHAT domain-containing protein [Anaerolineae bacterium]